MDLASAHKMVLETLQQASSQNSAILKPAEQKLKEWETIPGFYTILFNIFSNETVDINVRWIAILYFKNGIDRYWRRGAPNGLSEEEKSFIRQNILSHFKEPVQQIATQLAVLISKIARLDCPREWGELIPVLLTKVKSHDELEQHRTLLTLHHVIKTLSTKRLVGDRKLFQELTAGIYGFMLSLWETQTSLAITQLHSADLNPNEINKSMEKAMLSLRILSNLTIQGLKKPHEFTDANSFLEQIFDRTKTLLQCRTMVKSPLVAQTERFIIKMVKVLLSLLEFHPFSFVDYLNATMTFTVHYAFTPEGAPFLFHRFLIQCLNLLKGILLCVEYKPAKIEAETKEPETLRAHHIKISFFNTTVLDAMCRKLITHYFLLTPQDLQQWGSDPEVFATDESGDSWKYSLRPCTESLFLALFYSFRGTLTPVLLQLISQNHSLVDPHNLPAILAKDAVYNAVGLAAFDLFDEVDIDKWFSTSLKLELQIKDGHYRIIRRRVAGLLAKWTGVKLSCSLRPALYEAMLPLLQPNEDLVVRLTACNTIKCAVDDFEFNTEQFLNYIDPLFDLLFTLLKEVRECDTKMHVLGVLSFVVERVGTALRPYAQTLIQYLPMLWEESSDHNMLRCTIVSTLVHLVRALGTLTEAPALCDFLLAVVRLSVDIDYESYVYLLEDGLDLWLTLLENTSTISQPLLQLYSNMSHLLELSSENLKICLYITQAYVLLSPDIFLQHYGETVVRSCAYLMSDLNSEGIEYILRLFQVCLRAHPVRFVTLLEPALPNIFKSLYNGEEVNTTTVTTMHLAIIARVLLLSEEIFTRCLVHVANMLTLPVDTVTTRILDVWIDTSPLVIQPERSKVLSLALCSLLTSQSVIVLQRFAPIAQCVTWTLNDTKADPSAWRTQDPSPSNDYEGVDYKTEHDIRRERLMEADPIDRMDLQTYFNSQLEGLRNQLGADQFRMLIESLNDETRQQMCEYVTL